MNAEQLEAVRRLIDFAKDNEEVIYGVYDNPATPKANTYEIDSLREAVSVTESYLDN